MSQSWLPPFTYTSRLLYERVRLHAQRAKALAEQAELHPSAMSRIVNRRQRVRIGDPRLVKLGRLVGLKKSEVFEPIP